ncbi:MAG: transposase, partial [Gammaproteobacteria bacterium]
MSRNTNSNPAFEALVGEIAKSCRTQEDFTDLFKQLKQRGLEAILNGELTEHLGYDKHQKNEGRRSNNRNGYSQKTIQTEQGDLELSIPR